MPELTCEVCGAPAETQGIPAIMNGLDDKGEFLIVLERVVCAAGHWYNQSGGEVHG